MTQMLTELKFFFSRIRLGHSRKNRRHFCFLVFDHVQETLEFMRTEKENMIEIQCMQI